MQNPKVFCSHTKMVPIEQIKENPDNPNVHPHEQIELLSQIIKKGWRLPITVSNQSGLIVRGHGRLLAAKMLGLKTAPVDFQDYDTRADELADMLADNKIPELSFLDIEKTDKILDELSCGNYDLLLSGFTTSDIEQLNAELEKMLEDGATGEDGKPSKRNIGEKQHQVKAVLYVDEIGIFEKALSKTGEINRGKAIIKICESYLNGNQER